mmetsp:Transcript_8118/g.18089  ORF Transcript_8118/g.18089 Transcript_8118/m.18089 type:complete len:397 (-) Transcript_8118:117-1307(-)
MGQSLILVGAASSIVALAFQWQRGSMRTEPRHAPGNLELEHAQHPIAPGAFKTNSGTSTPSAPPASGHLRHDENDSQAGNTIFDSPSKQASELMSLEAREPSLHSDVSYCQQIAEEVRKVREQVQSQRKQRELAYRARLARMAALQDARQLKEDERRTYPCPGWLTTRGVINVAVTGNAGVGKSSFINTIRGLRARDQGAADVSPNETTLNPTPYDVIGDPCLDVEVRLWDLPGAGTKQFPREHYIQNMGLRYFDVVIILTASRYTETEIMIAEELHQFAVPYFMVRNKVDADISNNEDDHGVVEEDTLCSLRSALEQQGVRRPYLVSSKFAHRDGFDMTQLKSDVFLAMCEVREVERHQLPSCDGNLRCSEQVGMPSPPTLIVGGAVAPTPAAAG